MYLYKSGVQEPFHFFPCSKVAPLTISVNKFGSGPSSAILAVQKCLLCSTMLSAHKLLLLNLGTHVVLFLNMNPCIRGCSNFLLDVTSSMINFVCPQLNRSMVKSLHNDTSMATKPFSFNWKI